ncbi:mechanosensitive ion channel family protein [Geomonas sp. Red69]|uniref:Mechanosensitive ion channel family protein n=1 Tax=Geomonas diazotrophica TaxID=2843197 RepID=A0ABX8JQQ5_9BACT|nr:MULTISPECIES: mechanosensitive ion channel family protein [Geomonas]MBU5636533.1 mechanosensitive ion channel family protein [Geomonas diazotrophica]QWV98964.1 mechanosensitive ion channel family protein [Geomonas nitrogeniifigens]QXE88130.1 mechanosensitive ion channel family protein [Geomonas nitrogeniifigens]
MDNMGQYQQLAVTYATEFGTKIIAVIIFWLVGRWLIGLVGRLLQGVLEKQKVDATLMRYIGNFVAVTLNIILVVAILGYCGFQTTTFAALVAGIGIAIGAAWGGLLSNLAAGVFLVVLHPFKVGDFVTVGGVTGTVKEIGLFVTSINTPDNVLTMVGNGKIFSDNIQNYTANPFRRVELKCQLAGGADHVAAMKLLRDKLATVPNVLSQPPVEVEILEFTLVGPVLAVRPFCHNDNYWQVYFDGNRIIRESLATAGFPAPMPAQMVLVNSMNTPAS